MFACSDKYEVESAGFKMVDERSRQLITQTLVDWADFIILMDEFTDHHFTQLSRFSIRGRKTISVLGISDIYPRGDPNLIALLKERLADIGISVDGPT